MTFILIQLSVTLGIFFPPVHRWLRKTLARLKSLSKKARDIVSPDLGGFFSLLFFFSFLLSTVDNFEAVNNPVESRSIAYWPNPPSARPLSRNSSAPMLWSNGEIKYRLSAMRVPGWTRVRWLRCAVHVKWPVTYHTRRYAADWSSAACATIFALWMAKMNEDFPCFDRLDGQEGWEAGPELG